jgi:hypothetical protein
MVILTADLNSRHQCFVQRVRGEVFIFCYDVAVLGVKTPGVWITR